MRPQPFGSLSFNFLGFPFGSVDGSGAVAGRTRDVEIFSDCAAGTAVSDLMLGAFFGSDCRASSSTLAAVPGRTSSLKSSKKRELFGDE